MMEVMRTGESEMEKGNKRSRWRGWGDGGTTGGEETEGEAEQKKVNKLFITCECKKKKDSRRARYEQAGRRSTCQRKEGEAEP